ncbi:MAG TPA: hypothetical protein VJH37_03715 [Candidatus Nanoarchaeia archaeon]|nr:hypothetical protein [Candidatus Nanoarchaeia archaeon]
MAIETKPYVKGYETDKITTFRHFKNLMLDLLRGYPAYEYYGKFESVFAQHGQKIVNILDKDKIIELSPKRKGEPLRYRLTPAGINLAVSLINLEYGERVLKYSKEMRVFTITVIIIAVLTLFLGVLTFYFQFLR